MNDSTPIIEKDVPVPNVNNLPKLPLKEMQVGDSFPVNVGQDSSSRAVQTLRQRISRHQTANPETRFTVKRDPKGDGMRVWRVM